MTPARGDRKPCTVAGYQGTMPYGRWLPNDKGGAASVTAAPAVELDTPGWRCRREPAHYQEALRQ